MKNFVLNGAMNVDQNHEGAIYYSAFAEVYSLDQWRFTGGNNGGQLSIQRVPFPATTKGFKYCLQAAVTNQQATLTTDDNFHLEHPMEGIVIAPWAFGTADAQDITVSFYLVANAAGDYSFAIMNGNNTRSYVTSFNVPTANVVQKVEITIPGDTGGTWQTDPCTFGAKLLWSFGVGSSHSTSTTETWQGAAYWNKTGTVQLITNANNTSFYIWGVQCELGSAATEYEHLEPSVELLKLQRYYFKTFPQGIAVGNQKGVAGSLTYISQYAGVNGNGAQLQYPVALEGYPPVITTYNPVLNDAKWYNPATTVSSGAPLLLNSGDKGVFVFNPQVAADVKGSVISIHLVANCRMGGS